MIYRSRNKNRIRAVKLIDLPIAGPQFQFETNANMPRDKLSQALRYIGPKVNLYIVPDSHSPPGKLCAELRSVIGTRKGSLLISRD